MNERPVGAVQRAAGPLVEASGLPGCKIHDLVHVGVARLVGEVIRLGEDVTIQVYEDTTGLRPGEPVTTTGAPLSAELGPGLLGSIFDGLQRPLPALLETGDPHVGRGLAVPALDRARRWAFAATRHVGDAVAGGDTLGTAPETAAILHRVLVPPGVAGHLAAIHDEGSFGPDDIVATIETGGGHFVRCTLSQRWPVRRARPHLGKLDPNVPLITGQRVIDTFFPIARGGTAIIPGAFGTGKTVTEQTLAKWADAQVVVYVGCGERGNEMAEVLEELPRLTDPATGTPLLDRTVIIANTSNMPVAAREASVYMGATIAEYYRDIGYDVLLLVDSTSRWAEALREVSSRLEEMPGEEGYPAYLASRVAALYERSGPVRCQSSGESRWGSLSIVGAVSPPGGDFSEPMTQSSLSVAGAFWALDPELAHSRHFPAISWTQSYSLYLSSLSPWFREHLAPDWDALRSRAMAVLQEDEELKAVVQLVGPDALPAEQRVVLAAARMLREDYLHQLSYQTEDAYCSLEKAHRLLRLILGVYDELLRAVQRGGDLGTLLELPRLADVGRLKLVPPDVVGEVADELLRDLVAAMARTE